MANSPEHDTLICLFHHTDRAERTVQELLEIGIPQNAITLIGRARMTADIDSGAASLDTINVPDADRNRLSDGLKAGGSIVAVSTDAAMAPRIETIFKNNSADKIDEKVMNTEDPAPMSATSIDASAFPSVITSEVIDMPAVDRVVVLNPPVVETLSAPPATEINVAQTRRSVNESVVITQPADLIEDEGRTEPTSATTFRFDPNAPVDDVRNPAADRLNDPLNRR